MHGIKALPSTECNNGPPPQAVIAMGCGKFSKHFNFTLNLIFRFINQTVGI
jgi:hypothetical protein